MGENASPVGGTATSSIPPSAIWWRPVSLFFLCRPVRVHPRAGPTRRATSSTLTSRRSGPQHWDTGARRTQPESPGNPRHRSRRRAGRRCVGAPASRPRLLRRARYVEQPPAPAEVPLSMVTFVKGPCRSANKRRRRSRLEAIRFSDRSRTRHAGIAQILNVAIRAHRAGAHDPYAIEVTLRDARRVRIGYGAPEQVQEGRWEVALELSP